MTCARNCLAWGAAIGLMGIVMGLGLGAYLRRHETTRSIPNTNKTSEAELAARIAAKQQITFWRNLALAERHDIARGPGRSPFFTPPKPPRWKRWRFDFSAESPAYGTNLNRLGIGLLIVRNDSVSIRYPGEGERRKLMGIDSAELTYILGSNRDRRVLRMVEPDAVVMKVVPPKLSQALAVMELEYVIEKKMDRDDILTTTFGIAKNGSVYVVSQKYQNRAGS